MSVHAEHEKPILRKGAPGPAPIVQHLQDHLREKGFDPGPSDGFFGPQTENAVKAFQSANGLDTDGVVGPATWEKLHGGGPSPNPGTPGAEHPDPIGQITAWGYEDGVRGFQESFAWHDIAIDGAAGPETAKAVQKVVDEGGKLSPHFAINEFRSQGNNRVRVHRELVRACEDVRGDQPLGILSAYRDDNHNKTITGAAPDSMHVKGLAVDPDPYQPRQKVGRSRATGIGISHKVAPGLVSHFDCRHVVGKPPAEFPDN